MASADGLARGFKAVDEPVMQVNSLPERIVSWIKRATVDVEFVAEDELHFG